MVVLHSLQEHSHPLCAACKPAMRVCEGCAAFPPLLPRLEWLCCSRLGLAACTKACLSLHAQAVTLVISSSAGGASPCLRYRQPSRGPALGRRVGCGNLLVRHTSWGQQESAWRWAQVDELSFLSVKALAKHSQAGIWSAHHGFASLGCPAICRAQRWHQGPAVAWCIHGQAAECVVHAADSCSMAAECVGHAADSCSVAAACVGHAADSCSMAAECVGHAADSCSVAAAEAGGTASRKERSQARKPMQGL